jgi:hypothetical protein
MAAEKPKSRRERMYDHESNRKGEERETREGEHEGKKYYLTVATTGHTYGGELGEKVSFAIQVAGKPGVTPGLSMKDAGAALKYTAENAGLPKELATLKKMFGLDKAVFLPGESAETLKDNSGPSALPYAKDVLEEKAVEEMTPEEIDVLWDQFYSDTTPGAVHKLEKKKVEEKAGYQRGIDERKLARLKWKKEQGSITPAEDKSLGSLMKKLKDEGVDVDAIQPSESPEGSAKKKKAGIESIPARIASSVCRPVWS